MTCDCATEGCYATITLDPKTEDRLRSTHETFYCPAGHRNYFPGKTKKERRIEELESSLSRARSTASYRVGLIRELVDEIRSCPVPGCDWRSRRFTHSPSSGWKLGMLVERVKMDRDGHLAEAHGIVTVPDDASELVTG